MSLAEDEPIALRTGGFVATIAQDTNEIQLGQNLKVRVGTLDMAGSKVGGRFQRVKSQLAGERNKRRQASLAAIHSLSLSIRQISGAEMRAWVFSCA